MQGDVAARTSGYVAATIETGVSRASNLARRITYGRLILSMLLFDVTIAVAQNVGFTSDAGAVPPSTVREHELLEPPEVDSFPWWAGELALALGGDYSSGDYGQRQDTDMLYIPFTATYLFEDLALTPYEGDQLELRVTMSYLRIRGEGTVLPGGTASREASRRRSTEEGFGDIYLLANYIWLPPWLHVPLVEFGVLVKVPTASANKGLGTGETDVTFQWGLAHRFGNWSPFVTLGYRFMGSSSEFNLENRWLTSMGMTYQQDERWSFGLAYDYREAASAYSYDSHELVPYASIRLGQGFRLGPYVAIGLSKGSPDYAVGVQMHWSRLFR